MNKVEDIIQKLDLKAHPEGGYFTETYRSTGKINKEHLNPGFNGKRNYSTCIYFLLTSDNFSAFHRIKQDEIWHFYDGSPIKLHTISNTGAHEEHPIGNDLAKEEFPQHIVEGGYWFAAEVTEPASYSLVGCTVSPGFSFEDFELAEKNSLISKFPQHKELIKQFTHN